MMTEFEKGTLNNVQVIITIDKENKKFFLKHGYNAELFGKIKEMGNSFWIKPQKTWIIKGTNEKYLEVTGVLKKMGLQYTIEFVLGMEEEEKDPLVQKYIKALKMKNYSLNTIKAYTPWFKEFVNNYFSHEIEKLTKNEILEYIKYTINQKELDETQKKHLICSIKFYYEKMLGYQKLVYCIPKQNKIEIKNIVLNYSILKNEILKIEKAGEQLLIFLKYYIGLSYSDISELTLEKVKSILTMPIFENQVQAKSWFKQGIIHYYNTFKPEKYLFEINRNTKAEAETIKTRIRFIIRKYKIGRI